MYVVEQVHSKHREEERKREGGRDLNSDRGRE